MSDEFRQFWKDWDDERSRQWLRERYLSFRLHHAELQTYASPEEFADLFVEWCSTRVLPPAETTRGER